MSVPFFYRWQIHIVAVYDCTEFDGIGGTFKRLSFKHDILMRDENVFVEMLVEPGAIAVHATAAVAEEAAKATENGEDKVMEDVIACLCHMGMDAGETEIDIHREFRCQPLQPRNHIPLIRKDIHVKPLERQRFGSAAVLAAGIIVAHLTTLEVTQYSPLLIESLIRLVVLKDILRMRMVFEIPAEAFETFPFDDEIDIVIPWDEAAMSQSAEDISAVEATRDTNLLGCILEIDSHIQ